MVDEKYGFKNLREFNKKNTNIIYNILSTTPIKFQMVSKIIKKLLNLRDETKYQFKPLEFKKYYKKL